MSVDNYGNHPNLEEERRKKAESFRLNIPDRDNYDDYNYMDDYDDETSELNSYSGEDVREQIERQSRHALKKQKRAEKKAKELYDKNDYDVVITDIIMPEQDGFEVILDYRNKNQLDRVIAISGGGRTSSEDYLNIANHFGVSSIFSKPPNYKDLVAKVNEIVAAHGNG